MDQFRENSSAFMQENLHLNSRVGFIKKVFGIVGAQLTVTALWTTAVATNKDLNKFVFDSMIIQILTLIAGIVSTCCLAFSKNMRNTVPTNYLLLMASTFANAYSAALTISFYPGEIIAQALVITAAIVMGIAIYAWNSTSNFSSMKALIYCSVCLIVANLVLRFFIPLQMFHWAVYLLSGAICGFSLLYQIQAVFGKKEFKYESDDYILASLNVYYDIVDLFLTIVRILNSLKDDKDEKKKKKQSDI